MIDLKFKVNQVIQHNYTGRYRCDSRANKYIVVVVCKRGEILPPKYSMVVEVSEGKENVVAIEKANQYYKKLSINTRKFSFIVCGSCCYSSFYGVNLEIYLFKLKTYIFFGAEVLLLRIYSVILSIQGHNEFYRKIFNAAILLKKKKETG